MLRRSPFTPGLALALCIAGLVPLPGRAAPIECPQVSVSVSSAAVQDAIDVCAAAGPVFAFFRELGHAKATPLAVSVVVSLPEDPGSTMLGCYTPASRSIRMLTFEAARGRGAWFGRPFDRSLYRSLAAHEVAHALAWCDTSDDPLSVRAREYVAYVVMFHTMEPEHRQAILAAHPERGFESEREISDIFFYLAPSQFGVNAYRHYLRPENGPRFLREVLRGAALPASED